MNNQNPQPHHLHAAALAYDPMSDKAPRLVAKGSGIVAQNIINKAKEHNLPVHEDPNLLHFLMRVDIDENIPQDLYVAVAHVLALIWHTEEKLKNQSGTPPTVRPPV